MPEKEKTGSAVPFDAANPESSVDSCVAPAASATPIRVIIADDHPIVRSGLRSVIEAKALDIEVTAEASDGRAAVRLALENPADVCILDITMPLLNGIDAMTQILKAKPDSKILILSVHDSRPFVMKALEAGAAGYLLKDSASDDIVAAIREVHGGGVFLSPAIEEFRSETGSGPPTALTDRETQILDLLCDGKTGEEIAGDLILSVNTIRVHIKRIMAKLGVHRRADLVRLAIETGMIFK